MKKIKQESKSRVFEKISKIVKAQARLTEKKERTQITHIRNKEGTSLKIP